MIHKYPLQLLIFFLVLSSDALQTRGSFVSMDGKSSRQKYTLVQGAVEFGNGEEMFDTGEEFMVKERFNLQTEDYPGTGANNHHDPKTPGRV